MKAAVLPLPGAPFCHALSDIRLALVFVETARVAYALCEREDADKALQNAEALYRRARYLAFQLADGHTGLLAMQMRQLRTAIDVLRITHY
jgi:hypothetical protein